MKRIAFLVLSFFILSLSTAQAGHMSGGEIQWKKVGVDSFLVSFIVYRNCSGIALSSVSLNVSSSCGTQTLKLSKGATTDITPVCNSQCSKCTSPSCSYLYGFESTEFTAILNVRPWRKSSCCQVTLAYNTCCRDQTTNLSGSSAFYIDATMNICLAGSNSSPIFKQDPINILCIGQDVRINIGAHDRDTDSLTQSLTDSLVFSLGNPKSSATAHVSFNSGYSYTNPISYFGSPKSYLPFPRGFHFDSLSGELLFRPMLVGTYQMSFKVEEYRNGKKIGEVVREFYTIVQKCPNNDPPAISTVNNLGNQKVEITTCPGKENCFFVEIKDTDRKDTLYYSYESNLPNFPNQSKTIIQNGDSIKICYTPDSASKAFGKYYIDINIEDDACPIPGKSSKRVLFNIGKPAPPELVLTKKIDNCGAYKYELKNKNGGVFTEVRWTIDGLKVPSDGVTMDYNFSSKGDFIVKAQVSDCYNSIVTDTVRITTLPEMSITGLNDTTICAADSTRFSYQAKAAQGLKSFNWKIISSRKQTPTGLNDSSHWVLLHKQTERFDSIQVLFTLTDSQNCIIEKEMVIHTKGTFQPDSAISSISFCATMDSTIALKTFHPNAIWSGQKISSNQLIHNFPWKEGVFPIEYRAQTDTACYYKYEEYVVLPAIPGARTGDTSICGDTSRFQLKQRVKGTWSGNNIVLSNYFSPIGISKENLIFTPNENFQRNKCYITDTISITQTTESNEIKTSDTSLCVGGGNIALKTRNLGVWSGSYIENSVEFNPTLLGKYVLVFSPGNTSKCQIDDTMYIEVVENTNSLLVPDTIPVCITADTFTVEGNTKGGSWSGFGIISSTPKIRILPSDLGVGGFDFVYTDEDDKGCLAKDTTRIEVGDLPMLNFSVINNKFDIKEDSLEIRNNSSNSSDVAYAWFLNNDKTPFSTQFEPKQEITKAGIYSILLVSLNTRTGCTDTLRMLDAFTAEDEIIDGVRTAALHQQVSIFPNPANSTITISNEHQSAIQLEIIDLSGKVVLRKLITTGQSYVEISDLACGFYQVFFNSGDQMIVKKLIKK